MKISQRKNEAERHHSLSRSRIDFIKIRPEFYSQCVQFRIDKKLYTGKIDVSYVTVILFPSLGLY